MERMSLMKQITRVSVRSAVPIGLVVFFVLGVFAAGTAAFSAWLAPGPITSVSLSGLVSLSFNRAPPAYLLLLYPVLNAVAGALFAAVLAWLYNLAAEKVGPLRVTLSE